MQINWGILLALVGLALMYPVGVLINLTTPLIRNKISTWSQASLRKRIALLEKELAALDQNPAMDDVEHQILWEIKTVKMSVLNGVNSVVLILAAALSVI